MNTKLLVSLIALAIANCAVEFILKINGSSTYSYLRNLGIVNFSLNLKTVLGESRMGPVVSEDEKGLPEL